MSRARDTANQINRVNSSAADATAITVDSSENVLYGTTDTTLYNNTTGTGTKIGGDGRLDVARQADTVATFNRTGSSDGEVIRIVASGTTVGGIGVSADGPAFGTASQQVAFHANKLFPCQGYGSNLDNTIDLGYSGSRFKDAYLSGGIHLGGTGSANKLDDFETGTWTPTLQNVTVSYSDQQGTYTKIGNVVTARFEIGVTGLNTSDGSTFQIGGLPFTVSASGCLFTMDTQNSNVITNKPNIIGSRPNVNSTSFRLLTNNNEYTYSEGTNSSGSIIGMIEYYTAS